MDILSSLGYNLSLLLILFSNFPRFGYKSSFRLSFVSFPCLHKFFNIFLNLSGTTKCFKLILYSPCPNPDVKHFPKKTCFLSRRLLGGDKIQCPPSTEMTGPMLTFSHFSPVTNGTPSSVLPTHIQTTKIEWSKFKDHTGFIQRFGLGQHPAQQGTGALGTGDRSPRSW